VSFGLEAVPLIIIHNGVLTLVATCILFAIEANVLCEYANVFTLRDDKGPVYC
jgi:hypothetical protein